MPDAVNFNGRIYNANEPLFTSANRAFHYGDGCFETMKLVNGKIPLWNYHEDRLVKSLSALKMNYRDNFNPENIYQQILELADLNHHQSLSRIRLTCFRGNGSLHEFQQPMQYLIESFSLEVSFNQFNEQGLVIDFYPDAVKCYDAFSFIKSNNYLPSVMAAIYAKDNNLDDVIFFNSDCFVAETSVANIFIIKNEVIKTPSLNQGCINGIMRKYLLKCLTNKDWETEETSLLKDDIENADEVFITNAVTGIRWITQCGNKKFNKTVSAALYKNYIEPLWQ